MLYSVIVALSIGLIFGLGIVFVEKKFAVEQDPRVEKILEILPGANCGACGFAGCADYAQALIEKNVEPNLCTVGGGEVSQKIGEILEKDVSIKQKLVARITCNNLGTRDKFQYKGIKDCRAAIVIAQGFKECDYACLGLGTCIQVCPFGAIVIKDNQIEILEDKCTGCGLCIKVCPKNLIKLFPVESKVYVKCNSQDKALRVREVCKNGCIGCGICVKFCPQNAIKIEDNLAVIDYEKCDNCGICVQKCPPKCIVEW